MCIKERNIYIYNCKIGAFISDNYTASQLLSIEKIMSTCKNMKITLIINLILSLQEFLF